MNWHQIEGSWRQFKAPVRQRWGRLTETDLETIGGPREVLVGKIRERYGVPQEAAERQVHTWFKVVMKG